MTAFKLSSLGVAALSVAIGLGTARAAQQPAAADAIDRVMQDALVRGRLASLTAQVRRGGQIIFSKSIGYADLEQSVKATPDGLYAIGSITKSMTAYCIFTLVSEGKLKLSDRLSDILPDYPGPGGQATILQLLTHTSGIPDYAGDSAPDLIGDPTRLFSEKDVVALFAHRPLVFSPGDHWQYSNSGFFLLGLVIEKVTGRPYDDVVHDVLFRPFALTQVIMDYRQPLMKNRVRGYTHGADGNFQNKPDYDATIALAAGGYRASVGDLTRYMELLFSDKVSPAIHDMMLAQASLNDGTAISYRPAALVASDFHGHRTYSHGGGIWGFHAFISYMPSDQVAIGLMTNTDDGPVELADLDRQIARIVLNIPQPEVRDYPLSRREGESYAGTYCLRELLKAGSQITISYDGRHLLLAHDVSGSTPQTTQLRNQRNGRFVPSDDGDASVRFSVGKNGARNLQIDKSPRGTLSGPRCPRTG
ncbi:MAG TPA: serine hydrolase domain-containing protein [Steroidobacteraceae bacterium]|nr:serine hydrolase domain-containing protein [Steroidobacteraceae bacterium]